MARALGSERSQSREKASSIVVNLVEVQAALRAAASVVTLTVAGGDVGAYPGLPWGAVIDDGAKLRAAAALPCIIVVTG